MNKSKIIKEIYLWVLVVAFMVVLCAQFCVWHSFVNGIETSNYFALLLSVMGFSVCVLSPVFRAKIWSKLIFERFKIDTVQYEIKYVKPSTGIKKGGLVM